MAKATFFHVGNGDSMLVEYRDGRLMLIDYCDQKDREDKKDKRIDLPEALRKILKAKRRDNMDVAAFTHADADHVARSEEFFWLEFSPEYQGEGRAKIDELWVPALFILESGLEDSALVIQKEARHRLKKGQRIRVFSHPGQLDGWLKKQGIDPQSRRHLIVHAGQLAPGFSRDKGGAEVFVHSPFSFRFESDKEDRNDSSLVLHVTFFEKGKEYRVMFGADAEHQPWTDIVLITEAKKRVARLKWNAFKVSHHCSHDALAPEAGDKITKPVPEVKRLFEKHGQRDCRLISSSNPVGRKETPPHKQAAAYYKKVAKDKDGTFEVTMEHPSKEKPVPIVIDVSAETAEGSKADYGAMSDAKESEFRKALERNGVAASFASPVVASARKTGRPAVATRPWYGKL